MKFSEDAKFYISCGLVAIFEIIVIFAFSFSSHAENNNPFYFPALIGIPRTYNNLIDANIVNSVKSSYEDLLANSYGNDVSGNDIIICSYTPNSNNEPDFHFTCFNLPELSINATEITYRNNGQHYVDIFYDSSTGVLSSPNFYGGWINSWSTTFNNLFNNGNGWVVYYADPDGNGLFGIDTTLHMQRVLLWTYNAGLVPDGAPDVTPLPNNPDLDNPEIDNPTPSTPPTMPQYDPNISVPENIGNWFSWLGSLITYNFNNLFTNIKGFFNNLFNNLKSWLTTLKDVIYNGFQNIIDNFSSLFKPFIDKVSQVLDYIKDSFEWITEPYNSAEIENNISSLPLFSVLDDYTEFSEDIHDLLDIDEPESWTIYIHLEDLDYFDTGLLDFNLTTYALTLGSNILPFRTALRTFLWVLTTVAFVFLVERSLPDWLKGSETASPSTGKD